MKPILFFALICLLINSCQKSSKKKVEKAATNHKPISQEQYLNEAKKDHEIYGAFDLSKDSIVLLRRSVGIELSADRGKTWTWLGQNNFYGLNEFTVDNNGTWWGLERWKGIHEPSFCRMYSSTNAGKTWKLYEQNTGTFFPYNISSKPREPLEVITFYDKKVYQLMERDPKLKWKLIKQLPNHDNDIFNISIENYFLSRENDNNKLYVKRKNGKTDTLLSFTKAYNIYYIQKAQNMIYVSGPAAEGNNSYFAVIKNEKLFEEFIVPDGDLKVITTQFDHIYLTGTEGAYRYEKGKLIHIFK